MSRQIFAIPIFVGWWVGNNSKWLCGNGNEITGIIQGTKIKTKIFENTRNAFRNKKI